jgi:hypothetical protein
VEKYRKAFFITSVNNCVVFLAWEHFLPYKFRQRFSGSEHKQDLVTTENAPPLGIFCLSDRIGDNRR